MINHLKVGKSGWVYKSLVNSRQVCLLRSTMLNLSNWMPLDFSALHMNAEIWLAAHKEAMNAMAFVLTLLHSAERPKIQRSDICKAFQVEYSEHSNSDDLLYSATISLTFERTWTLKNQSKGAWRFRQIFVCCELWTTYLQASRRSHRQSLSLLLRQVIDEVSKGTGACDTQHLPLHWLGYLGTLRRLLTTTLLESGGPRLWEHKRIVTQESLLVPIGAF